MQEQPATQELRHAPGLGHTPAHDIGWFWFSHLTNGPETILPELVQSGQEQGT
nr:hypothetical protein [Ktedonobacter sp. SOSP1-52]